MQKRFITAMLTGLIAAILVPASHAAGRRTAAAKAASSLPNTRVGDSAGSAAAGANSELNPSGNTFINTSPSGSTLAPGGSAPASGRR